MRRIFWMFPVAALLSLGALGHGGPVIPQKGQLPEIPQFSSQAYTLEFKGGQRASVIAIGNGETYMGLYVYDADGNCVAWDDFGNSATRDDLAVDWVPSAKGFYTIEVRNCGAMVNACKVNIH